MKKLKYLIGIFVLLTFMSSCEEKVYNDLSFLENTTPPSNLSALFDITQDNTGLVTIIPIGEGVSSYEVSFGDATVESAIALPGESIQHNYTHGIYTVKIIATSITGLTTKYEKEITVTFKAPENMVATIENDLAVSKKVNVSATADYATVFDVYFGEVVDEVPVTVLPGVVASYVYENAGDYDITIVAKSGSPITLSETTNFTVTEITQPVDEAPTPPLRASSNVISVFSGAYSDLANTDFNPNWGQVTLVAQNEIAGNLVMSYANFNYQGTSFENPIDASSMEYLHVDMWTFDATQVNLFCISSGPKEIGYSLPITKGEWVSYDIPMSYFSSTVDLADIIQFKFDDGGTGEKATIYLDNIYFYK